jgi:probable F420-dependent oxidoreductase
MDAQRPFRFGVSVRRARSGDEWARKARRAEELGFSTFLVADHFGDQLATTPALAAAAAATSRIRLGSFVHSNDFRHPALLAKEAATLDLLSGGRFELGLGAGWMRSEYMRAGIPFDAADTRLERLAESVTIVKRLLEGESVSFAEKHYAVEELQTEPTPLQRPRPPVLIGGSRAPLLELAAREADIVGLAARSDGSDIEPADLAEKADRVWEAAGGRELELNILVFGVRIGGDRVAGADELARELGLPGEKVLDSPYVLLGEEEEIADTLLEQRERHGISYVAVFEEAMESLARVMERLPAR